MTVLNGDWAQKEIVHFHTDSCDCGGGAHFSQTVLRALQLLLGSGCPACQLYRWKNFERASCFMLRGMRVHSVMVQALLAMYSKPGEFEDAEQRVLQAARQGDVNHGAAQTVRAGKVVKWLQKDYKTRRWSAPRY